MLEKKREAMLKAGAYDGHFRPRVVKSKKSTIVNHSTMMCRYIRRKVVCGEDDAIN